MRAEHAEPELALLALDRVAHRARERGRAGAALDDEVLRSVLDDHRPGVLVAGADEHDDRRLGRGAAHLDERVEAADVGETEVEQHAVGAARLEGIGRLVERLDVGDLEGGQRAVGELLGDEQCVAGAVLDDQQPQRLGHAVSGSSASVKWTIVPRGSRAWTQMRPPWRLTIFLTIASPTPVPGYASRVCRRWNISKTRSRLRGSMPMPLSATEKCHSSPSRRPRISTRGASSARNFSALATRFWKSCASCTQSPSTVGRSSATTAPPESAICEPSPSSTSPSRTLTSMERRSSLADPTREYVSRPSSSALMRSVERVNAPSSRSADSSRSPA